MSGMKEKMHTIFCFIPPHQREQNFASCYYHMLIHYFCKSTDIFKSIIKEVSYILITILHFLQFPPTNIIEQTTLRLHKTTLLIKITCIPIFLQHP